ncbi:MAG: hypothetical protein GY757_43060 [bacterium]|nr:hypothetical protein [bacterium]
MSYKNISIQLSEEDKNLMIQKFEEAGVIADTFVVDITLKEKKALAKMGKKNFGFIGRALGYAKKHPNFVPSFVDLVEQEKDLLLASQLQEMFEVLGPLYEKLKNTQAAVGAEAYLSARLFYDSAKAAAKAGIPGSTGIAKDLGELYKKTVSKKESVEVNDTAGEEQ